MLTSTAAERKRTVAACRALRSQIQRFEEAFIQLHGRPPKGAQDRAPLATTYAQYREWKRAIRSDAACRIQALFRGALCRRRLLRINSAALTQVILKRAGRTGGAPSLLKQLGMPSDIGGGSSAMSANAANLDMLAQQGSTQVNPMIRPRTGSAGSADSYSSPRGPSGASDGGVHLGNLTFPELQARKRDLKQKLKQYDMDFAERHGRMPVKAEKEPIRHLYQSYNLLKNEIIRIEQEGAHHTPATGMSPVPSHPQQRTVPVSPSSGSESGNNSDALHSPLMSARSKRKLPKPQVQPAPTSTSGQDLASLKTEKGTLHTMLRSYEKEFYRENNRQVSSFVDIRPVAAQYRRYKEIKRAILVLQQQASEGS
jgi:hypothetical protein